MEEEQVCNKDIDARQIEPYIQCIKQYFGLPFIYISEECEFAHNNPEEERLISIAEYVPSTAINELLFRYFDKDQVTNKIMRLLWLVANLYYCGNIEAQEAEYYWETEDQEQRKKIREEIAQLYSFFTERETLRIPKNQRYYPREGREIEFKSDKGNLKIRDTECWIEALLENYLFPNWLPDVANDEDAQKIWKKENKPVGRKARTNTNAIIHGVASFLQDEKIVDGVAPKKLCLFILDYLDVMNYLQDPIDHESITTEWIKAQIHNFRKLENKPQLFTPELEGSTIDELSDNSPANAAYHWLYYPNRIKKEERDEGGETGRGTETHQKKSIGTRIDLLLSHTRDIFRKGVYKKGKKENTSQS